MEIDDLYLDVFLSPKPTFQTEKGCLSTDPDVRKLSTYQTASGSQDAERSQTVSADESSVDLYGDLSMDTICQDNLQHSPPRLQLQADLLKFKRACDKEEQHHKANMYHVPQENDKLTLLKLKEVEDKNLDLVQENAELKQCKEQLMENISSLCLAARRIIQGKDEEISKLKESSERQKFSSFSASKLVQTELEYSAMDNEASRHQHKPHALRNSNGNSCRVENHEEEISVSSETNEFVDNSLTNLALTSAASNEKSSPKTADMTYSNYEGSSFKASGFPLSHIDTKYNSPFDLRNRLKRRKQENTDLDFHAHSSSRNQCRIDSFVKNAHNLVTKPQPCKEQKVILSQPKIGSLSEKHGTKKLEKRHYIHSEVKDRLQREINLSFSLADCQGVASRKKSKDMTIGKQDRVNGENGIPHLKTKHRNETNESKLMHSPLRGAEEVFDMKLLQSKRVQQNSSLVPNINSASPQSPEAPRNKSENIAALPAHQQETSSTSHSYNNLCGIVWLKQAPDTEEMGKTALLFASINKENNRIESPPKDKRLNGRWSTDGKTCTPAYAVKSCESNSLNVTRKVSDKAKQPCGTGSVDINPDMDDRTGTVSQLQTPHSERRGSDVLHHCHERNKPTPICAKKSEKETFESHCDRGNSLGTVFLSSDDWQKRRHVNTDCDSVAGYSAASDKNTNCNSEYSREEKISDFSSGHQGTVIDTMLVGYAQNNSETSSTHFRHVTCTSNLIVLGEEDTSCAVFDSPDISLDFPSEFYPPGERGHMYGDSSYERSTTGHSCSIQEQNSSDEVSFQSHFIAGALSVHEKEGAKKIVNELCTNIDFKQQDSQNNTDCEYSKWKPSETSSELQTHAAMLGFQGSSKEVGKTVTDQGSLVQTDVEKEDTLKLTNNHPSVSAQWSDIETLKLNNRYVLKKGGRWVATVERTFKEAFDKDMSKFKKEMAMHPESKVRSRLQKAKVLRGLGRSFKSKMTRNLHGASLNVEKAAQTKYHKLSALESVRVNNSEKLAGSAKVYADPSSNEASNSDSSTQALSDHVTSKQRAGTSQKHSLLLRAVGDISSRLSPDSSVMMTSECHNKDGSLIGTSFVQDHLHTKSQHEPDSTSDYQGKSKTDRCLFLEGDMSKEGLFSDTVEKNTDVCCDLGTFAKSEFDSHIQEKHQLNIPTLNAVSEISCTEASLSEFDSDIAGSKVTCSVSPSASMTFHQKLVGSEHFKAKDVENMLPLEIAYCNPVASSLTGLLLSLSEENSNSYLTEAPRTSEDKEKETAIVDKKKRQQTEMYGEGKLSRHMSWFEFQKWKEARSLDKWTEREGKLSRHMTFQEFMQSKLAKITSPKATKQEEPDCHFKCQQEKAREYSESTDSDKQNYATLSSAEKDSLPLLGGSKAAERWQYNDDFDLCQNSPGELQNDEECYVVDLLDTNYASDQKRYVIDRATRNQGTQKQQPMNCTERQFHSDSVSTIKPSEKSSKCQTDDPSVMKCNEISNKNMKLSQCTASPRDLHPGKVNLETNETLNRIKMNFHTCCDIHPENIGSPSSKPVFSDVEEGEILDDTQASGDAGLNTKCVQLLDVSKGKDTVSKHSQVTCKSKVSVKTKENKHIFHQRYVDGCQRDNCATTDFSSFQHSREKECLGVEKAKVYFKPQTGQYVSSSDVKLGRNNPASRCCKFKISTLKTLKNEKKRPRSPSPLNFCSDEQSQRKRNVILSNEKCQSHRRIRSHGDLRKETNTKRRTKGWSDLRKFKGDLDNRKRHDRNDNTALGCSQQNHSVGPSKRQAFHREEILGKFKIETRDVNGFENNVHTSRRQKLSINIGPEEKGRCSPRERSHRTRITPKKRNECLDSRLKYRIQRSCNFRRSMPKEKK